ncbi:MAG: hypothetical protein MZV70_22390 [Desulfobacterales bacterium]|nr:hypothetical protein [Desulfobacterales bacterium]
MEPLPAHGRDGPPERLRQVHRVRPGIGLSSASASPGHLGRPPRAWRPCGPSWRLRKPGSGKLGAALDVRTPAGPGSPSPPWRAASTVLRGLRTRTAELRKGISDLETAAQARGAELARLSGARARSSGGHWKSRPPSRAAWPGPRRPRRPSRSATVALAAKAETDVQEYRLKARTEDIARARGALRGRVSVPEGAPGGPHALDLPHPQPPNPGRGGPAPPGPAPGRRGHR